MPDKKISENGSGRATDNVSPTARRATGPHTATGKRRSRYNALKSGLFATAMFLPGESGAQYWALAKGLCEEFEPESASEREDCEYLAALYWRRRRGVKAENSVIAAAAVWNALNRNRALVLEAWDQSRAGETTGGMLRYSSNPLVLQESIALLSGCRNRFQKVGFDDCENSSLLRKLYGLNHDGTAPTGLALAYQLRSEIARGGRIRNAGNGDEPVEDPKNLTQEMLAAFDREIERLKTLEIGEQCFAAANTFLETMPALTTRRDVIDAIVRVQAHTSREIERTLNRLEHARRRRQGLPEPPTLRLKLDE